MLVYFANKFDFNIFLWEEIYWLITWSALIYWCLLDIYLIGKSKDEQDEKRAARKDMFKLALLFVSLLLWEILNCINTELAYSKPIFDIMGVIAGILIISMVLDKE